MSQEILLGIVKTWNLNERPEYRGFRCANCQNYMNEAWHHWLTKGGYKSPVHFCNSCETDYESSNIIIKPPTFFDKNTFGLKFPKDVESKLIEIQKNWNTDADPIYKNFECDDCGTKMLEAYHVWFNMDKILIEEHFCKDCGDGLHLGEL